MNSPIGKSASQRSQMRNAQFTNFPVEETSLIETQDRNSIHFDPMQDYPSFPQNKDLSNEGLASPIPRAQSKPHRNFPIKSEPLQPSKTTSSRSLISRPGPPAPKPDEKNSQVMIPIKLQVESDPEPEQAESSTLTEILYHMTNKDSADKIKLSNKMLPGSKGKFGPAIYFTENPSSSASKSIFGSSSLITAKVKLRNMLESNIPLPFVNKQILENYGKNSVKGNFKNSEFAVYDPEDVEVLNIDHVYEVKEKFGSLESIVNYQTKLLTKHYQTDSNKIQSRLNGFAQLEKMPGLNKDIKAIWMQADPAKLESTNTTKDARNMELSEEIRSIELLRREEGEDEASILAAGDREWEKLPDLLVVTAAGVAERMQIGEIKEIKLPRQELDDEDEDFVSDLEWKGVEEAKLNWDIAELKFETEKLLGVPKDNLFGMNEEDQIITVLGNLAKSYTDNLDAENGTDSFWSRDGLTNYNLDGENRFDLLPGGKGVGNLYYANRNAIIPGRKGDYKLASTRINKHQPDINQYLRPSNQIKDTKLQDLLSKFSIIKSLGLIKYLNQVSSDLSYNGIDPTSEILTEATLFLQIIFQDPDVSSNFLKFDEFVQSIIKNEEVLQNISRLFICLNIVEGVKLQSKDPKDMEIIINYVKNAKEVLKSYRRLKVEIDLKDFEFSEKIYTKKIFDTKEAWRDSFKGLPQVIQNNRWKHLPAPVAPALRAVPGFTAVLTPLKYAGEKLNHSKDTKIIEVQSSKSFKTKTDPDMKSQKIKTIDKIN